MSSGEFPARMRAIGAKTVHIDLYLNRRVGTPTAPAELSVAVDSSGHAYVTGLTGSPKDFPLKAPLQPTFGGGSWDAFVVKIDCGP